MNKLQLIDLLQLNFNEVVKTTQETTDEALFARPADDIWSAAENMQHLTQSVRPLAYLMAKPKEYLVEKWGKTHNAPRPYNDVVIAYGRVLSQGLKASGNFIPLLEADATKADLLAQFNQTNAKLLEVLASQWTEEDLDTYIIPHPVMGAMSVREMMYFTAFHTQHHHEIMQKRIDLVSTI